MARIQMYDTTLRDGSQGEGVYFSLQDKLLITQKLDSLGVDFVEGGYPLSNPKDKEYFDRVRELPLQHVKIAAFGMTCRKDRSPFEDIGMQALLATEAPVLTIVGKTWDLHVREVLRVSEDDNLRMISETVQYLVAEGRRVFYDAEHFFDGWKGNPDYALRTIEEAAKAGAEVIVLCDTNGGCLPDEITAGVSAAKQAVSTPLGIHCHNDSAVAVANSLAAVDAGVIQVQGTINGLGERCGNADLVSVIANLALKKDNCEVLREGCLRQLCEVSRYVYELANMNFRHEQPFVGASAFAHKGGMHVHAVNRLARSYEHIEPELVGNTRRIVVSELSGRSNIVAKAEEYGLRTDEAYLRDVLEHVQNLEAIGYQFEAAEASFVLLMVRRAGGYQAPFERLHFRVNVEADPHSAPLTEATVKLRVGESIEHVVAEGDGPVNALDNALRKALLTTFPQLGEMHLVDYKVRVINSAEGTAARVRVVIESRDPDEVWTTIGVSENVIEASWAALVDSVEYKLLKSSGALPARGGTT